MVGKKKAQMFVKLVYSCLIDVLSSLKRRFALKKGWRNSKRIICLFNIPNTMISDNRKKFVEKRLEEFLKNVCIKHRMTLDWEKANNVCNLLSMFNLATHVIFGSEYSTSNIYLAEIWKVKLVLDNVTEENDLFMREMVAPMKESIEALICGGDWLHHKYNVKRKKKTIPVSLMHLHLYDRWLASLCFSAGAGFEVQHNCCSRCYLGFMKDPFLQVRAFALEGLLGFYECDRESSDVVFLLAKPSSLART
ncbi:hypothetical protein JHK84_027942 [Glycine max]|nr:hypothetical protein JHK84_027942 [Glycine max]